MLAWKGRGAFTLFCRTGPGRGLHFGSTGLAARPMLPLSPRELLSCLLPAWSLTPGNALMLEECQVWDVVVPKP